LYYLQIFQRITPGRQNISFDVHPKGEDKIDDQGGTHGEKGDIDEPGPDAGSGYTHSITDRSAHSENLPLDEVLESVHTSNLKKIANTFCIKNGPIKHFLGKFASATSRSVRR
jgi:hypothetical protein